MNQQDHIFQDLGPISQEDHSIAEQELVVLSQMDSFDRESICTDKSLDYDYSNLKETLINTQLNEITKKLMSNVIMHYSGLLILSQQLTALFGIQESFILKTTQLTKLCLIGQMQLAQIMDKYGQHHEYAHLLGKYEIKTNNINEWALNQLFEYQNSRLFPELQLVCEAFFDKPQQPKVLLGELRYQLSKLLALIELIPKASAFSMDDMLCNVNMKQLRIIQRHLGTEQEIISASNQIMVALQSAQAMLQQKEEVNGQFMSQLTQGLIHNFGSLYFMLAKQQGQEKARQFVAEPKLEVAFNLWNLGESGMIRQLMPLTFHSIKYFMSISHEYIKQYCNIGILKQPNDFMPNKPTLIPFNELLIENNKYIKIRVLCSQTLQHNNNDSSAEFKVGRQSMIDKLLNKQLKDIHTDIIIHIHGGGFVAMSSRSHQNYTRRWANSLNVPVFSIDYGLSPEKPFPQALDDCWQAYLWILHFTPHYFNIIPKKVVLVGDSAGGNLVAALTQLCIRESVAIPHGILLAYPALDLNPNSFSPSRILALDDILLPHTFLKLCVDAYVQSDEFQYDNQLISPGNTVDEILDQFPTTRIMTGSRDPLHDDALRFQYQLQIHNRDCQLYHYQHMPHGFLSFDPFMPQCSICVEDGAIILRELLSINQ